MSETIAPILDSAERTPNLWKFDLQGRGKPLTTFIG
jgi:hypothetical protein